MTKEAPDPGRGEHPPAAHLSAETIPRRLERVLDDPRVDSRGLRVRQRRTESFSSWRTILERSRAHAIGLRRFLGSPLPTDGGSVGASEGAESPDRLLAQHRVALVLPTGEAFFHAFFACIWAGAVPVPIYPPPRFGDRDEYREQTRHRLDAVLPSLVWTSDRLRRHRTLLEVVEGLRDARGGPLQLVDFESLAEGTPAPASIPASQVAWPRLEAEDLGLIQFSSGTTGWAKPIALSHRALLEQTDRLLDLWPEEQDGAEEGPVPAGVSWLPLYHDMGLVGCVLPAALRPGDLTLLRSDEFVARPAAWLQAISDRRATISPAPDFAYRHCVERVRDEDLEGCDLSSWNAALDGSELVRAETLRRFTERFAPWGFRREALRPVYGMAETALAVTHPKDVAAAARILRLDGDALAEDRVLVLDEVMLGDVPASLPDGARSVEVVSVGCQLPDFRLEIRGGVDGRPLGDGEVGEIWVRGPSLLDGALYVGPSTPGTQSRQAFVRPVLQDGWLATGDRGFLRNGELYVLGRLDDVLNFAGRKLAPERIEDAVHRLAGVEDSVAGIAGEGTRADLALLVECRLGDRAADDLIAEIEATVLQVAGRSPSRVELLRAGQIARTSSGKKRRRETFTRHRAGSLRPLRSEAESGGGSQ